jgi:hypothetical protein
MRQDGSVLVGVRSVRRVDHHRGSINFPLPGLYEGVSMALMAAAVLPVDGRQSHTALAVARGTTRLLRSLGFACVSELVLASGRRADVVALGGGGDIWIVEIKSSVADFRADQKWMDYRLHCDRLFFATTLEVPCEIFPPDTGLIVADAFGASIMCEAPEHRLAAATRKNMLLRFGHAAASRLQALHDPQGPYGGA